MELAERHFQMHSLPLDKPANRMAALNIPESDAEPIVRDGLIHIISSLDDSNFSFLGLVTTSMAEYGVKQTVILEDDPRSKHLLDRFHPAINLVVLPYSDGSVIKKIGVSLGALKRIKASQSSAVVHLHGVAPNFSGLFATRFFGIKSVLYGSLHGAENRTRWSKIVQRVLLGIAQWISASPIRIGVASSKADTEAMHKLTGAHPHIVSNVVDAAFFRQQSKQARRPLVSMVSREQNKVAAALFSQLAVLLNGKSPPLTCHFLGTTNEESAARLQAAEVRIFDASDPADRSNHLFASWVYVDFGGRTGFPVFLAEAMAAGLPCIAWNIPEHRDLIKHDRTGLLCDSHDQMLAYVTELIESPERREKLGTNAREEAMKRFDIENQKSKVLSAYEMDFKFPRETDKNEGGNGLGIENLVH